jgi:proteasome activator subunit 4
MHICNWVFCGFDGVHGESRYMLRKHADDTTSLSMLVRVIGAIGNYGSVEYSCWGQNRQLLEADAKCLIEPHINFITNCDTRRRRRPFSIIRDKVELHNTWRSSQQGGWHGQIMTAPPHLAILSQDLLDLSLHNYHNVRS